MVAMPAAFTFSKAWRHLASSLGRLTTPEPVSRRPAALSLSPTARHSATGAPSQLQCNRKSATFEMRITFTTEMNSSSGRLRRE